ncbi:hypothetical protein AB3S75_018497, partial [Citrus x aurantiifolia]
MEIHGKESTIVRP